MIKCNVKVCNKMKITKMIKYCNKKLKMNLIMTEDKVLDFFFTIIKLMIIKNKKKT